MAGADEQFYRMGADSRVRVWLALTLVQGTTSHALFKSISPHPGKAHPASVRGRFFCGFAHGLFQARRSGSASAAVQAKAKEAFQRRFARPDVKAKPLGPRH